MEEQESLIEINVAAPLKLLDFSLSAWTNPQNLQPETCCSEL
jgi:hypothetical protein